MRGASELEFFGFFGGLFELESEPFDDRSESLACVLVLHVLRRDSLSPSPVCEPVHVAPDIGASVSGLDPLKRVQFLVRERLGLE